MAFSPLQPIPLALWSRRLAVFGFQILLLAVLLHRFSGLPTPALLGAIKVAAVCGITGVVLALVALRQVWRGGTKGVAASLTGMIVGIALAAWPAALIPATLRTPALMDISTDTASPPQFRDLARLREPGSNPIQYPGEAAARLQLDAFPDIKTMVVTRPGPEAFDLTREIIRRMKWSEVAARPLANPTSVGEIEARVTTPVIGFRDDVIIRLKGERDRTRIDIRSVSPYGRHDLGRNAERVRALMSELHIRLDLGVPLEPEQVARRRSIRKKMLQQQQARGQVTAGQTGIPAAQSQPSSARERAQRPEQRSRDEGQARGKQRRQSWE